MLFLAQVEFSIWFLFTLPKNWGRLSCCRWWNDRPRFFPDALPFPSFDLHNLWQHHNECRLLSLGLPESPPSCFAVFNVSNQANPVRFAVADLESRMSPRWLWPLRPWKQVTVKSRGGTSWVKRASWDSLSTPTSSVWRVSWPKVSEAFWQESPYTNCLKQFYHRVLMLSLLFR